MMPTPGSSGWVPPSGMAPPPAPAPRPRRKRVRLLVLTLVPVLALGGAVAAAALLIPPPTTAGEASASPHFSVPSSTATTPTEQAPTSKPPASKPPPHTRVVKAKDGKSELTVPKHWRKVGKIPDLKHAALKIGHMAKRQFVIVTTANKQNFAGFPEFAKLVRDAEHSDLKKVQVKNKRKLKVNGMPAIRWHYAGNIDGMRLVYWNTAVHGQKAFYQVIGVSTPSHAEKSGPVIRRVLDSFRETAIDV